MRKTRSTKEVEKANKALSFVRDGRIVDRARYREIRNGRKVLEAIYRIQTAQQSHKCESEKCPLGGEILPHMDYARVLYEDTDEVEKFHKGCFHEEFKPDA